MKLKNLQPRSQESYLSWVKQIDRYYIDCPAIVPDYNKDQVLDFLLHLKTERNLAPNTVNQALCALRTLYRDHLKRDWTFWSDIKIKRDEPLPHVLTRDEIAVLLNTFREERYRIYFTVVYQCGFRKGEALRIKPKHIDGQRLTIRVTGKGNKQREVPITKDLLLRLRIFWKSHRNPEWLFPGTGCGWRDSGLTLREALRRSDHHMSCGAVESAFNIARTQAGLMKCHEKVTIHTLRHSFATHMLEAGTSVRQVAAYLGHTTLKPTMIYLHLTEISEEQARKALYTLPPYLPKNKQNPKSPGDDDEENGCAGVLK